MNEKRGRLGHGYQIIVKHEGDIFFSERRHAWGVEDELPQEWEEVKADPTVVHAEICTSTQSKRRIEKRTVKERYIRE